MSQEEKIQKIIRLKRHETPREGYFEDFLEEFQSRREEENRTSPKMSATGRVGAWFRARGKSSWVLGSGLAYAAVVLMIVLWPKDSEVGPDDSRQPVIFQPDQNQSPVKPPKKPAEPQGEF